MTRGIVILEGADGAGKTTLAHALLLAAAGGGTYVAPTGPTADQRATDWARYDAAMASSHDGLVVADRWHLSEAVYGQVFRGGPAYDVASLDAALTAAGAVTVLCVPSDGRAHLERFSALKASRGERFDTVTEAAGLFRKLAAGDRGCTAGHWLGDRIRDGRYGTRADVLLYDMDYWRGEAGRETFAGLTLLTLEMRMLVCQRH